MSAVLGFVLTDGGLRHVWCGPGMRRIEDADMIRVPPWYSHAAAQRASRALRRAIGLRVQATPLSLPKR
jgi:hypothetical protein